MAAVINDRDTLLLGSPQRGSNPLTASLLLSLSASVFHVNTSNVGLPSTITVTADLINLVGTASFSATGATVTNNGDNTATVAFNSLTGDAATIKATVNSLGEVYTKSIQISKVYDGKQGDPGPVGNDSATVFLYQFSTATPPKPTGTSGYTWETRVNSTYGANDGWSVSVPDNPLGPNTKLYIATVSISAPRGTASTIVSYANATVAAWTANGADGVSGVQQAAAIVYQWAASIPLSPIGPGTYTWGDKNGAYTAPSGWYVVPPNPPSQGITLWAARVNIVDSAKNTHTDFDWGTSAVYVAGNSGTNGTSGAQGASNVIAYCASYSITPSSAPQTTTGKNSVPAPNSGGITGTWSKDVPTLAVDQRMFRTDGTYDPINDTVLWNVPYLSTFKAGSISAITTNTGDLTVTGTVSDGIGNWSINSNGHMIAKSADFIDPATNEVVLSIGGKLNPKYAPDGTQNSDIALGGRNLIPANSLPSSAAGYTVGVVDPANVNAQGPMYVSPSEDWSIYSPGRGGVVWMHAIGTPPNGSIMDLYINKDNLWSIVGGRRYEFSVGLSTHRCTSAVEVYFYDAAGTLIIQQIGSWVANSQAVSTSVDFPRSTLIYTTPPNAVKILMGVREQHTGESEPYTFTSQWYFGEASATQTIGSPWSESPARVAQDAAAGKAANTAIPGINTSLAAKLQADSHATLTGQLSLQAKYALLVGDQDNGIYYGGTGIYGRKNGLTTFGIGADGSATYSGALYGKIVNAENINVDSLSAVSGTIGTLRTSTSGERTEISDNVIKMFSSNNQKILHIGDSSK